MSVPLPYDDNDDRIPELGNAFGEVLRRHRRMVKLTQEELAVETGLDRTFVSLMERGLRRPSLTTVFILARRFGVKASQLVEELEERLS